MGDIPTTHSHKLSSYLQHYLFNTHPLGTN